MFEWMRKRSIPVRCVRTYALLAVLAVPYLLAVGEVANPQWKYVYLLRHLPYDQPRAAIDADAARIRLKKGMSKRLVFWLLGRPVDPNGGSVDPAGEKIFNSTGGIWCYNWTSSVDYFYVTFDDAGQLKYWGMK